MLLVVLSRFTMLQDSEGKVGKSATVVAFSLSGLSILAIFAFKPNISIFLEETFSGIRSYMIFILAIGCFLSVYESVLHATQKRHLGFGFAFLSTSFLLFTIWSSTSNVWLFVIAIISLIFSGFVLIFKKSESMVDHFSMDHPFASSSDAERERIISENSHLLKSMKKLDDALRELGREFGRTEVPTAFINRLSDDKLREAIHTVIQLTNDFLADLVTVERSNREAMEFVGTLPQHPTKEQVDQYLQTSRAHATKYYSAAAYRIANDQKETKYAELKKAWETVEQQHARLSRTTDLSAFEHNFIIPWRQNMKMVEAYVKDKDIEEIDEYLKKILKS